MKKKVVKNVRTERLKNRKQVDCPICHRRLIDSGKEVHSQVSLGSEVREADYYAKCWNCGNEIGIRMIK